MVMLTKFNNVDRSLSMLQTSWASEIDPFLARPTNQMNVIPNVQLAIGNNVINHLLGQVMQGWSILDIDGPATIYRSAPLNKLTLTLNSSAAVMIKLGVF